MRNTKSLLFGLAAMSALIAAGCGGSAPDVLTKTVALSGGSDTIVETNTTPITSSSTPEVRTFGTTSATVPAGLAVPAGNVGIIDASAPVIGAAGTGPVTVNGMDAGVTFENGSLSGNLALPPTTTAPYELELEAPTGGFQLGGNRADNDYLTVKNAITFNTYVLTTGAISLPSSLGGGIPVNGSQGAITASATFPTEFEGYQVTITMRWVANQQDVTLTQTRTIAADGTISFSFSGNTKIPNDGIDTLAFTVISQG